MKKLFLLLSFFVSPVFGEPITITADEITFDHNTGVVKAEGGIQAHQGKTTLSAPHAEYETKTKGFTSWGGVHVQKEGGESFYTESIHTEDGLYKAQMDQFELNLSDGASVEAKGVEKEGEDLVLMDPSYTACNRAECPLTWEVRAKKISKNGDSLSYKHAWLNLWGVPIFYTPYLSHPTPKAKRQSGLLFPQVGSTADLGTYVKIPYYLVFSPTHDLTLLPMTTTEEGEALGFQHRKNFRFGQTRTEGLYTQTKSYDNQTDRWHVSSDNIVNLTPVWRGFLNFNRTSDDTFMRKYDIKENVPYLETRGGFEGLWNRSYLTLRVHDFQDLRPDTTDEELPQILPDLNYQRAFDPFANGSFFSLNLNTASLNYNNNGTQSRVTGDVHWTQPFLMSNG
ncbi:MAG: LPS-assembly protein LptD, partial [Alphaproteobacteria bacterium]|nr:LPS-assembly protein LptD [Alphaproteobacteria bacterium]